MKQLVSRIKTRLNNNQGNSFIVVVATVSFLAILTAALLVAVALIYRLKAYDLNTRDNFYYLEQAMYEIYAGVGGDSMKYLNQAYDDTIEVLVYYDADEGTYKTKSNTEANAIMKKTYMHLLSTDTNYSNLDNLKQHLIGFLSYPYDDSTDEGKEGIQLEINKIIPQDHQVTVYGLTLSRRATYSTVNARSKKNSDEYGKDVAAGDTFVQSITTDLVIGEPAFEVNFNSNSTELNELYEYSMIADMGIEITDANGNSAIGDKVNIAGNIYAASDFYNKTYNENPEELKWASSTATTDTIEKEQIQKVNNYDIIDKNSKNPRLADCDGVNAKSMYSGIYVDGAEVTIGSDRLIVPGTLAALNKADITVTSLANTSDSYSEMWVDSMVLDGYALKQDVDGKTTAGASLYMKAKVYASDDLELNAKSSRVSLNGEYYGYNYASTDNRTYSTTALGTKSKVYSSTTDAALKNGKSVDGQAHYNSSAIIINGDDASLDLSNTDALYVAGQAYVEVSKKTTESKEDTTVNYEVTTSYDENGKVTNLAEPVSMTDKVKTETDEYLSAKDANGNTILDADGNPVSDLTGTTASDNYTTSSANTSKQSVVQDYRTGEAISIKSNQLAYIPPYLVHDDENGLYVSIPTYNKDLEIYKDFFEDLDRVQVIKSVVEGKAYYFFDFTNAKKGMNEYMELYASLFNPADKDVNEKTPGDKRNLTNIVEYEFFQVKELKVKDGDDNGIYTNSAITTKVGDKFTIKASENSIKALTTAASNINSKRGTIVGETQGSQTSLDYASSITTALQSQYKEVKWLLTDKSKNNDFVNEAHYLSEDLLTPINHYFDFSLITDDTSKYCALESGYGVWISNGDVKVGAQSCSINGGKENKYERSFKNNKVRGIIFAKGDVTFDLDVDEFEGLIVTGGKIKINNFSASKKTMVLNSNPEIVKSVLRECDASQGNTEDKNFGYVCKLFRLFESTYKPVEETEATDVTSMKSISAIQFEDIISFKNWTQNVE